MKRSVFVQPEKRNISRNTSIENHPPRNLSDISRKRMLPSIERKNITVVSSARNAVTLLETVLTSLPKLFHLQYSSLLSENEDVESNFSEQSKQDDKTAFIIAESSNSDDISVDDISVISIVQTVNHVSAIPRPSLKMSILPSKFHKHVSVIGFIDTGADTSMIDPFVIPSDCWENHLKLFRAVNGETFKTTMITKKLIGIQFFPNSIIWKKIVASSLLDKDLLIDFDILHLVKNLFLTSWYPILSELHNLEKDCSIFTPRQRFTHRFRHSSFS
ncbi:hypothetical protein CUMW_247840 [Citrus unshiu]|uniref:Retropepsins domain-containing protein n=1 Tax=Citrus unshiu TaxID=55188 RepID=A0A2H5QNX5_CITUN|nr:hypothetical protein CUMW_247840 [Citrus unshiu]